MADIAYYWCATMPRCKGMSIHYIAFEMIDSCWGKKQWVENWKEWFLFLPVLEVMKFSKEQNPPSWCKRTSYTTSHHKNKAKCCKEFKMSFQCIVVIAVVCSVANKIMIFDKMGQKEVFNIGWKRYEVWKNEMITLLSNMIFRQKVKLECLILTTSSITPNYWNVSW